MVFVSFARLRHIFFLSLPVTARQLQNESENDASRTILSARPVQFKPSEYDVVASVK